MYGRLFYTLRRKKARMAARHVLPAVLDLVRPVSMVDVGCGTGSWLAEAAGLGVVQCRGLDGPWVRSSLLEIASAQFTAKDLGRPFELEGRFDMALSLEVAEHLPPEAAEGFVHSLCGLAPVVVFSAAIPGQGGEAHLNEQWPHYWTEKFARQGYRLYDVLRPRLWNDDRIPCWYRQNVLVFAAEDAPDEALARLAAAEREATFGGAGLVHPVHSMRAVQYPNLTELGRALPAAAVRTVSGPAAPWVLLPLVGGAALGAVTAVGKWARGEPEWSYYRDLVTQPLAVATGPDEKLFGYIPGAKALLTPFVEAGAAGYFLFLALSLASVLLLYTLLRKAGRPGGGGERNLAHDGLWLSACMAGPAYLALQNNQLVTLSALLTVLALVHGLRGREGLGAALLGGAVFLKTLPLLLLPMLVLLGRWRMAVYTALFVPVASLMLAAATDGIPSSVYHHLAWPHQVMEQSPLDIFEGDTPRSMSTNQFFLAYLTRASLLVDAPLLAQSFFLLKAASLLVLCILTVKARRSPELHGTIATVWLAWLVFIAPFGRYYYVLFLVPLWYSGGLALSEWSPRWSKAKWLLPLSVLVMGGHNPAYAAMTFLTVLMGIGLLVAWRSRLRGSHHRAWFRSLREVAVLRPLAAGTAILLAMFGTVHLLADSGSRDLNQLADGEYMTSTTDIGDVIVVSSERSFEDSSLQGWAIGIHSKEDFFLVLDHLNDGDGRDHYIVTYLDAPKLEALVEEGALDRVAADGMFVVYRETRRGPLLSAGT